MDFAGGDHGQSRLERDASYNLKNLPLDFNYQNHTNSKKFQTFDTDHIISN